MNGRRLRGGVYAYQRLARLWNDAHPGAAPLSGIAYQAYWEGGVSTSTLPLWQIWREGMRGDERLHKSEPLYLPWIEGLDGPCLEGY